MPWHITTVSFLGSVTSSVMADLAGPGRPPLLVLSLFSLFFLVMVTLVGIFILPPGTAVKSPSPSDPSGTTSSPSRRSLRQVVPPPPGPKPHFLLGNILEVGPNIPRYLDWLAESCRRYGGADGIGTWCYYLSPFQRALQVSDPRCVEHVLRTRFDCFGKGSYMREKLSRIMGKGIFAVDGPAWHVQRKSSAVMFRGRNFKDQGFLLTALQAKARTLMQRLYLAQQQQQFSLPGGGEEEEGVEIQSHYFSFTLDAIGHMAFGMDLGAMRGECQAFQEAFDYCQSYLAWLCFNPSNMMDTMAIYLTPGGHQFQRNVKLVNDWALSIIQQVKRGMAAATGGGRGAAGASQGGGEEEEGGGYDGSLLKVFLDPSKLDEDGKPFSEQYVKDILMSFIIAGRDTTAQGLTWATYLLATHPAVQEELRREIEAVIAARSKEEDEQEEEEEKKQQHQHEQQQAPSGTSSSSRGGGGQYHHHRSNGSRRRHRWELTHQELESLVYAQAVATEALRLYPSVPKDFKYCFKDNTLPDGTAVRRGDWVIYLPIVMGRSQALWGPDAASFRPERHLQTLSSGRRVFKPPSPFVFTAFQAGPRMCMGQQLAYLEMKYVLSCLVMEYNVKLAPSQDQHPRPVQTSLTMPVDGGLRVSLEPRVTTTPPSVTATLNCYNEVWRLHKEKCYQLQSLEAMLLRHPSVLVDQRAADLLLHTAVRLLRPDMLTLLLAKGLRPVDPSHHGTPTTGGDDDDGAVPLTPLMRVAQLGRVELVEPLLQYCRDGGPEVLEAGGGEPLLLASPLERRRRGAANRQTTTGGGRGMRGGLPNSSAILIRENEAESVKQERTHLLVRLRTTEEEKCRYPSSKPTTATYPPSLGPPRPKARSPSRVELPQAAPSSSQEGEEEEDELHGGGGGGGEEEEMVLASAVLHHAVNRLPQELFVELWGFFV